MNSSNRINLQAENHDRSRVGSRFGREYSILINIVIMLLPGAPGIYYGQEICMVDGLVRYDQERDTVNLPGTTRTRDLTRTPMQWDSTLNAGKLNYIHVLKFTKLGLVDVRIHSMLRELLFSSLPSDWKCSSKEAYTCIAALPTIWQY